MQTWQLHCGDAVTVLKTLPDRSVDCVVTSPPYFGLRDYQTANWSGGDPDCGHIARQIGNTRSGLAEAANRSDGGSRTQEARRDNDNTFHGRQFMKLCGKCGAERVDQQIGLEDSPQAYVASLVAVFAECRRVLVDEGTMWINLGSSYAASGERGNGPSLSPSPSHVLSCGSDGRALLSSQAIDSSYYGLCDGCQSVLGSFGTAGSAQPNERSSSRLEPTDRDTEKTDCASVILGALPLSSQASTTQQSSVQPLALCSHCANCGACLNVLRSSLRDGRLCVRTAECSGDTSLNVSDGRNQGRDASGTAWFNYTYKPKDLIPIPWLVAMSLQVDGWYLRSEIIWHKKSCMPESVKDRPTKAHEQVFLLTKRAKYFYDADAIREKLTAWELSEGGVWKNTKGGGDNPATANKHRSAAAYPGMDGKKLPGNMGEGKMITPNPAGRNARTVWDDEPDQMLIAEDMERFPQFETYDGEGQKDYASAGVQNPSAVKARILAGARKSEDPGYLRRDGYRRDIIGSGMNNNPSLRGDQPGANARSVWSLGPEPATDIDHFAVMPKTLARRCILAGCPFGGTVLDPFAGSGTTGIVALEEGRNFVGIELNAKYHELARKRLANVAPLLAQEVSA